MSNILNAVFDGSRRKAITCPLFQYDYGQILKISGVELPESYQVQFSNTEDAGVSKTMLGDADGVQIPDEYLLTGDYIYAFIFLHEGETDGETEYVIEIPVIRRPVPSEETPTPAEQSLIDQLLEQLNQGVEAAEAAADEAGQAAETAVAGMIDDTLTIQGKAADAKATGDEISQLKADLGDFVGETTQASTEGDWEKGEFATTTGAEVNATTRIRTKSAGLPQNVKIVNAINGYKFLAFAWSADSTYLGIWTGSGFNKTSASGLTITNLDLRLVYSAGASKVRIVLMKSNVSATIEPSDGSNLVYTIFDNDIPTVKDRVDNIESFVDSVKVIQQSGNIYQARTDDVNNRYYYRNSNGVLSVGINTDYIGFILPVLQNETYTFVRSNVLFLKSDKTLLNTSGGNYDLAGARTCYSGDAHYVTVSVRREDIPESGYVFSMGDCLDNGTYALSTYTNPIPEKKTLGANTISGSLADGEKHVITGKTGIRDGYYVIFRGTFSSFGTVSFGYEGTNVTNAVRVDGTNLMITSGIGSAITQAHGLAISDYVSVLLELKNSVMYITVESGGVKYQYHCEWYWTGSSPSEIGVSASGMSFTNTTFSVRFKSAKRSIWYFGDSYAEFNTNARIPYYVIEYGFDKNIMFNSISGSSSTVANIAFVTLLAYGNPKYAINALGMNDGSDTDDSTPNATWLANIQEFIAICERHNIIPILCTVPSIATVNNNAKNAWVKASGYRYIDMAGAVGADADNTWYSGMLSNDNIHPSALGATAQFMQLLADMPEIMG